MLNYSHGKIFQIRGGPPRFPDDGGIPLTYNISHGIGFGFISYTAIKLARGKFSQVHPLMYLVSLAFLLSFILASK
ncbi:MAG: hypothetical protein Q8O90_06625 [Elusimicrobiota bacterium]|nr:hypothetical protein [Elusimicrobiota bacterium]